MKNGKKWGLLFLVLVALTVFAVVSQSENFSFAQFQDTLKHSSPGWMLAAAVSMAGFIFFEGMAILCILRVFGYQKGFGRGFLYSAADIYFSSITPSATGGQPASAYFMMKDEIPGAVVTISLVANMIMYTLALLTVGTAGMALRHELFFHFHLPSRIFIALGYVILWGLAIAFCMLIVKPRILERICLFFLRLGKKIRLIKNESQKRKAVYHAMKEYRQCAAVMADHKFIFVMAFLFNLLQRISQITVTFFVYLAIGGKVKTAIDIWFVQGCVAVGTYSVPIPGGMGVADYLLLDGLGNFMEEAGAVNLELISRGLSFYVCMAVSAFTVFLGMFCIMKKKRGSKK